MQNRLAIPRGTLLVLNTSSTVSSSPDATNGVPHPEALASDRRLTEISSGTGLRSRGWFASRCSSGWRSLARVCSTMRATHLVLVRRAAQDRKDLLAHRLEIRGGSAERFLVEVGKDDRRRRSDERSARATLACCHINAPLTTTEGATASLRGAPTVPSPTGVKARARERLRRTLDGAYLTPWPQQEHDFHAVLSRYSA